jgi:GTP-binding protein HflX
MLHPDSKTFVGKGKLDEIKKYIQLKGNISIVIFDDELTGSQIINIEKELETKTIDRDLILDIFASRTSSASKNPIDWHNTSIYCLA